MNHILTQLLTIITVCFSCETITWKPFTNNHQHVAALILARGGSKGIPLKNLAKFGNSSLLDNTLATVLKANFSSVWVSTDHNKIFREVANKANVHWRSPESATDEAPSLLGVLDFVKFHREVDFIALIQCTSPFLKLQYLIQAQESIQRGAECVFSVTRSHSLRWNQKEDGTVQPINFNIKKRPRRQDSKGELIENGMFYFVKRRLINKGFLQSERYSNTNTNIQNSSYSSISSFASLRHNFMYDK